MFFKSLKRLGETPSQHRFVDRSHSYIDRNRGIVLVHHGFSIDSYDLSLYEKFNVYLPNQIFRSVAKRQSEFLAGRIAAKLAMKTIGESGEYNIKIGQNRAPVWPKELIGSISHSENMAMCIIGKRSSVAGLGLDVESILSTTTALSIKNQIHSEGELAIFMKSGFSNEIATTIIFSAKESFFKAVFPRVREFFGFECARVIWLNKFDNTLMLKIDDKLALKHGLKTYYKVLYQVHENFVSTLLCISPGYE